MKRTDLMDVILAYRDAVKHVQENWENGDLAGAVRNLIAVDNEYGKPAEDWWNSDE